MTRLELALVFTLAMPVDPALACHRFSIWHYRFPQRCPLTHSPALRRAPARMTIPLPSAPVAHDEKARALALEELRRAPQEPAWLPVLEEEK